MKGMAAPPTLDVFRALADEVRFRVLRAVMEAELSVAELVAALQLPQSTVSRHLRPLRESGLLGTRRDGTSVYYRRGEALADDALCSLVEARWHAVPGAADDRAAVRRVLDQRRRRSREFFDQIAGRYGTLTEPGGGWPCLAAALAAGFADREVADLGSGEGELTLILARFARKVTSVDLSPRMLELVRDRAAERGWSSRVATVEADLEDLPLKSGTVDAAFLSQALHHASRPQAAVAEAARILRPGGILLILDLSRHDQEWTRDQWADQWLGFEAQDVVGWMTSSGLAGADASLLPGGPSELSVLLATARKPSPPTRN